ncbi:MAG TPA: DUF937 domain-containing protein [Thermoanaerobaculia bacterium]|nr:DUF937 domain-containing protein [Thermoanaerobaculia bacterium]
MEVLNEIREQLGDGTLDGLARQVGAGRGETERAVGVALPMLIGALARNAGRSPQGADELAHALDRDHDPSLLDQLGGLLAGAGGAGGAGGGGGLAGLGSLLGGGGGAGGGLAELAGSILGGGKGGGKALDGAGILRHILGDRRRAVEGGVEKASGLDAQKVGQLLVLLAPLVMSALAKVKQQRQLDGKGLADALGREREEIETKAPGVSRGGLSAILDRDGDGEIADDLAGMGMSLAKAFFDR